VVRRLWEIKGTQVKILAFDIFAFCAESAAKNFELGEQKSFTPGGRNFRF
jgi:hypothetical protein